MLLQSIRRLRLGAKLNLILIVSFGFLLFMTLLIINNSILNFVLQIGQQRVQAVARGGTDHRHNTGNV
jgi:hypothetical protein